MPIVLLLVVAVLVLGVIFTLGYGRGRKSQLNELTEVRLQAQRAQREMYDLTRDAFVRMIEHAER